MGFLIYGSELSPALWYSRGRNGLTHRRFEGSGHDMQWPVSGEVPKGSGEVQEYGVGDLNRAHDGNGKREIAT